VAGNTVLIEDSAIRLTCRGFGLRDRRRPNECDAEKPAVTLALTVAPIRVSKTPIKA